MSAFTPLETFLTALVFFFLGIFVGFAMCVIANVHEARRKP